MIIDFRGLWSNFNPQLRLRISEFPRLDRFASSSFQFADDHKRNLSALKIKSNNEMYCKHVDKYNLRPRSLGNKSPTA